MNRKGLIVAIGLFILGGLCAAAYWALTQVPDFYAQALNAAPSAGTREQSAQQFMQHTVRLVEDMRHEPEWSEEFTHQQINSWLAEDLPNKFSGLVPKTVQDPRVFFAEGTIHIGFRYEDKKWRGVISVKARPWIPEPNQLAIEIESVRAGLVPISLEKAIEQVSARIEQEGFATEWKQRNGNDVLVVHFHSAKKGDPVLEAIEVGNGSVRLAGRRLKDSDAPEPTRTVSLNDATATDVADQGPTMPTGLRPTRLAEQLAESLHQIGKN